MIIDITKYKSESDVEKERENAKLAKEILDCFKGKTLKAEDTEDELPEEDKPIITYRKELENYLANDFYTIIQFYRADTDIERMELDRIFDAVFGYLKDHKIDDDYYTLLSTCLMSAILYAQEEGKSDVSLDDIVMGLEMLSISTGTIEFPGIKQAILKEIAEIKKNRKSHKTNRPKKGKIIEFKPKKIGE